METMIELYSSPTCHYCKQLKEFLMQNKVEYTEHNVVENAEKREELTKRSNQLGVPVLFINKDGNEEMIIGFDEGKIKTVLGL